jgi:hypothetical protein
MIGMERFLNHSSSFYTMSFVSNTLLRACYRQLTISSAPEICASVALHSSISNSRSGTPSTASHSNSRAGTPANVLVDSSTVSHLPKRVPTSNHREHPTDGIEIARDMPPPPLPTKSNTRLEPKTKTNEQPAVQKLSAYEIERNKNIAQNKVLMARIEQAVNNSMGIAEHSPPLCPEKQPKVKKPRAKRPPVPPEQLRRGRSATQDKL